MNILTSLLAAIVIDSSAFALCSSSSGGSSNSTNPSSNLQISANNTILQNLYALSLNQSYYNVSNSSLSYISLLLGLNSSCTANVTQILNSTEGNYTFFAPSDQAFRSIQGFPDFGTDFCQTCNESNSTNTSGRGGGIISRMFQSDQGSQAGQCPRGCNETSLAYNSTSSQLMPCLPQMLQYHLLNESLSFNSTSFGFLNRSMFNLTVLPSMLNSSCLVNLSNSTASGNNNSSSVMSNSQVLVFNITNGMGSGNNTQNNTSAGSGGLLVSSSNSTFGSSPFNVTILHGINQPANVTVFDIPSSNGILHVVDALLIPPANMTDTLLYTYSNHSITNSTSSNNNSSSNGGGNSTSLTGMLPSFLNQTDLDMYANMSGITVFLPNMNSTSSNGSSNNSTSTSSTFNITNYIFPTLLYNNRSFDTIGNLTDGVFFQQNLTNLNGENVTVLFGRNNAMRFNGSEVTESNILMNNGVLHLFQAPEGFLSQGINNSTNNTGNSTSAAAAVGLGRIFGQII